MAGSSFGQLFKLSTFGESHGGAVGVVLDGAPPAWSSARPTCRRNSTAASRDNRR